MNNGISRTTARILSIPAILLVVLGVWQYCGAGIADVATSLIAASKTPTPARPPHSDFERITPAICSDAKDVVIPADQETAAFQLRPYCFGDMIQTPLVWPKWCEDNYPPSDHWLLFQGKEYPTPLRGGKAGDPKTGKDYAFPGQFNFRAMGEGTLVIRRCDKTVTVETHDKPPENDIDE